jgi:hypothetical protein
MTEKYKTTPDADKIHEKDININRNISTDRMKANGYTKEEIDKFRHIIKNKGDISVLPCRCTDVYKCEICYLSEFKQMFGNSKKK